jgi:hypothetical protein
MKVAALRAFGSGIQEIYHNHMHSHVCRFQGSNPGVLGAKLNDEGKMRTITEVYDENLEKARLRCRWAKRAI